jgi:hypothetical protein
VCLLSFSSVSPSMCTDSVFRIEQTSAPSGKKSSSPPPLRTVLPEPSPSPPSLYSQAVPPTSRNVDGLPLSPCLPLALSTHKKGLRKRARKTNSSFWFTSSFESCFYRQGKERKQRAFVVCTKDGREALRMGSGYELTKKVERGWY